jgi:hypothetical protein
MRKRSTITHEAAVRTGEQYEPFYMLFARAEDGEVGSLVAVGGRDSPGGQATTSRSGREGA